MTVAAATQAAAHLEATPWLACRHLPAVCCWTRRSPLPIPTATLMRLSPLRYAISAGVYFMWRLIAACDCGCVCGCGCVWGCGCGVVAVAVGLWGCVAVAVQDRTARLATALASISSSQAQSPLQRHGLQPAHSFGDASAGGDSLNVNLAIQTLGQLVTRFAIVSSVVRRWCLRALLTPLHSCCMCVSVSLCLSLCLCVSVTLCVRMCVRCSSQQSNHRVEQLTASPAALRGTNTSTGRQYLDDTRSPAALRCVLNRVLRSCL